MICYVCISPYLSVSSPLKWSVQLRQPSLEVIGFPPALEDNTVCHRSNAAWLETPPLASKDARNLWNGSFVSRIVEDFGCDVIDVMIDAMILDTQLEVFKNRHHAFDRPNASNNTVVHIGHTANRLELWRKVRFWSRSSIFLVKDGKSNKQNNKQICGENHKRWRFEIPWKATSS